MRFVKKDSRAMARQAPDCVTRAVPHGSYATASSLRLSQPPTFLWMTCSVSTRVHKQGSV